MTLKLGLPQPLLSFSRSQVSEQETVVCTQHQELEKPLDLPWEWLMAKKTKNNGLSLKIIFFDGKWVIKVKKLRWQIIQILEIL